MISFVWNAMPSPTVLSLAEAHRSRQVGSDWLLPRSVEDHRNCLQSPWKNTQNISKLISKHIKTSIITDLQLKQTIERVPGFDVQEQEQTIKENTSADTETRLISVQLN